MRRVSRGYTIVEVIIFLAISAILFASAVKLIDGRQTATTFNQVMNNAQSQLEAWINSVTAGFAGATPGQTYCTTSGPGSRPALTSTPQATPNCIFLGKALQFTGTDTAPNSPYVDKIYLYSLFGCLYVNCGSSGTLPTNLTVDNMTPAVSSGADLTQVFNLSPAKVLSVTSSAVGSSYTTSHLVGFFNSLNTEQGTTTNGAVDLNAYQFRFDGSSPTPADMPGGAVVLNCLELISSPCKAPVNADNWPEQLQSLNVCISDSRQSALLTITSGYGIGATVRWQYTACT